MRYVLGLTPYLAVLGTAWIVRLDVAPRAVAVGLLIAAIAAATVGAAFGVGGTTTRQLPGARRAAYGEGVPPLNRVIVYSNQDYLVSGPHSHPNVLALFEGLRRQGVTSIAFVDQVESYDRNFEEIGLWVLARVAGLVVGEASQTSIALAPEQALATRSQIAAGGPPPCLRLADGSGVWVRVGAAGGATTRESCPLGGG